MAKQVGFLNSLKLSWLDLALDLAAVEDDETNFRSAILPAVTEDVTSKIKQVKITRMLTDMWFSEANGLTTIRKLIPLPETITPYERLVSHFCIMQIRYPIFAETCELIGKISSMQDSFTPLWLRTRLHESWGEREIIDKAALFILQTMVEIGIIKRIVTGQYNVEVFNVDSKPALKMLLAVQLYHGGSYTDIANLGPVFHTFPFRYSIDAELLQDSPEYRISSFGGRRTVTLDV